MEVLVVVVVVVVIVVVVVNTVSAYKMFRIIWIFIPNIRVSNYMQRLLYSPNVPMLMLYKPIYYRINIPIFISWTSSFPILGMSDGIF